MVGQIVEGMPWLGTFHSIGVKILRRHAELVGLKPDFTILDVDDQIRLKQLLEAGRIDEKRWPGRVLAGPSTAGRTTLPHARPGSPASPRASPTARAKLYAAYQNG
jgi:DNA helicase-2/ATP-dependent DNA helicase PcrA